MLPLGNWTGPRFGSSRKPDRRRCVPARSLFRTHVSFVQSTDAQRRRRRLCSGNGRCGADLVRSDGAEIQDTRALVSLVLAGDIHGGDHIALVADSLRRQCRECRALSACFTQRPESLALCVRGGRLIAVERAIILNTLALLSVGNSAERPSSGSFAMRTLSTALAIIGVLVTNASASAQSSCAGVKSIVLPHTRIAAATVIEAGSFLPS